MKEKESPFSMKVKTGGFLNSRFIFIITFRDSPFRRMEGIPREQASFIFNCIKEAYEKGIQEGEKK